MDRQTLKEELLEQIQEKDAIINGISDSLMLLNARTMEILEVNQAFLNDYRLSKEQVIGKTCHQITHHLVFPCSGNEDIHCPVAATSSTGEISTAEHTHFDRDGRPLHFEVTTYPLKNERGEVHRIIHLSRNITRRKRAEEEIKRQSENIKLFAYAISHDLRNPTIGLHRLAERLLENYNGSLGEKGRTYCEMILQASEYIETLVKNINVYIKAREEPMTIESVSLQDLLALVKEQFSSELNKRSIKWSTSQCSCEILADKGSLFRVLTNLVENSLKYGGERLSEIEVRCEENDDFHILSVRDNGMGLENTDAERIFELFARGTDKGAGMGLGLAIVKGIADRHKGRAWAESIPNVGITFFVSLSKTLC